MSTSADHPVANLSVSPLTVEDALLEQQQMSAVDEFAAWHNDQASTHLGQGTKYESLIPARAEAGQQFRFAVNLDQCFGCKACVTSCHHQNGLEEGEVWREVGLLAESRPSPLLPVIDHAKVQFGPDAVESPAKINTRQHLTSACHHCVEPACLYACPTNAYEKDETTGVVWHLDDQCFGCQYCVMACPYEVPKYSPSKGIVRKCDMCRGRLEDGEAPACVQSCPTEAISIETVSVESLRQKTTSLVPEAPPSSFTTPSTVYRSHRDFSGEIQAPQNRLEPQHAHWPLVWMLVSTQASVGSITAAVLVEFLGIETNAAILGLSWLFCAAGLLAASLHLGRPWLAFRGFLGWRHSWLSREAMAFAAYFGVLTGALVASWTGHGAIMPYALTGSVVTGWIGVFCSSLIYQFTRRTFWRGYRTMLKFCGTTLMVGLAVALIQTSWNIESLSDSWAVGLAGGLISVAILAKLSLERRILTGTGACEDPVAASHVGLTRQLHERHLEGWVWCRRTAAVGVISLLFFAAQTTSPAGAVLQVLAMIFLLCGEVAERALYFRAVIPWRMPGAVQ